MTQNDVRILIRGIELKTWPIERWRHDELLAMIVWYLTYLPRGQALRVICDRIAKYHAAQRVAWIGGGGYHETRAIFLAQGVGAYLEALPGELGFEQRVQRAQVSFRDFESTLRRYYATATLDSFTARRRWVAPDRQPMHAWLRACADMAAASEGAAARPRAAG